MTDDERIVNAFVSHWGLTLEEAREELAKAKADAKRREAEKQSLWETDKDWDYYPTLPEKKEQWGTPSKLAILCGAETTAQTSPSSQIHTNAKQGFLLTCFGFALERHIVGIASVDSPLFQEQKNECRRFGQPQKVG
jgi:hypothetical protein